MTDLIESNTPPHEPPLPWDEAAPPTSPRPQILMPFPLGAGYNAYSLGGDRFKHGVFVDAQFDLGLDVPILALPLQFRPNVRGSFGPNFISAGGGMNIFVGIFDEIGGYLNTTLNYVNIDGDHHGTLNLDFGVQVAIIPGLQGFLEIGGPLYQFETDEADYDTPHGYKLGLRARF